MHRMHGWQPLELRRWLFRKHTRTRRIFKNCKLVTPKLFSFYPFHFFCSPTLRARLLLKHATLPGLISCKKSKDTRAWCCQGGWFRTCLLSIVGPRKNSIF
jgi:hypothetical protein